MTHDLKCWPEYFMAILNGDKTFEVRQNDRDFKVWDLLRLREYVPESQSYTGRIIMAHVTHIMYGPKESPVTLPEGICIMAIKT